MRAIILCVAIARRLGWLAPALAAGVAACGSQDRDDRFDLTTPATKTTPSAEEAAGTKDSAAAEPVTRAEAETIRGWSTTLRRGNVAKAARYFALPSAVANGTPLVPLRTRAEAAAFNQALPCGAKVVALERGEHHFVVATFRLTERPGPGSCGTGVGALAQTAFLIRKRHIEQWIRVPTAEEAAGATDSPS